LGQLASAQDRNSALHCGFEVSGPGMQSTYSPGGHVNILGGSFGGGVSCVEILEKIKTEAKARAMDTIMIIGTNFINTV